ncbi:MAG: malonyl-CoA synthase [Gammaproteobacteria bacterium]|nr:malonyl-CoA synthase [Gammaproteobacteria bacterium]
MNSMSPYTNIYALFESRFPEDQVTFIETPDNQYFSYGDLRVTSARIANILEQSGVKRGDRVAVQVEKSPQALFLYLACLRAGFIYLPLNTGYTESELAYFMSNAEPAAVVCDPANTGRFVTLTASLGSRIFDLDKTGSGSLIDAANTQPAEHTVTTCEPDDVAVILYTSGTTGRPKGAMISHNNLAANGLALHQAWGWTKDDVLLHALPIFHIHGLFVACHCVLLNGSKMLFAPRFDTDTVVRLLPRSTVLMGVPTFYTRLLADARFTRDVCSNMRLFVSGSAPLLEQTFVDFRERTGHTILERYGMTETGMNTSNPLEGDRIAGTVGPALPGVEARVVDDSDQAVPVNTVGNLQVRGENVFRGYWRMPDKTAEEFTEDGFFRTGDMARINEQGYVSIVGRSKDMIITGGYNVYPKELESLIDDMDNVQESAVIGLPHTDFGEAVTAVIVLKDNGRQPEEAGMIRQLKQQLAGYKIPKKIIIVDKLPRNTMGKVQKNLLRDEYSELYR